MAGCTRGGSCTIRLFMKNLYVQLTVCGTSVCTNPVRSVCVNGIEFEACIVTVNR